MDKPYFVILNCQNGSVAPMVDDNGDLAMFENKSGAFQSAESNVLGAHFGFEIFELGGGEIMEY